MIQMLKLSGIFFKLYFYFLIVQVQLSPFSPHHGPLPHSSSPPTLEPIPFDFVHVSFIHVLMALLLISLSPSPSGYCQFVLYFNVPGYILLACLLFFRSCL